MELLAKNARYDLQEGDRGADSGAINKPVSC